MHQGVPWCTGRTSSPPRLYHSGERRPVPGTWPSTGRHRRHAPLYSSGHWVGALRSCTGNPVHGREGATLSRRGLKSLGSPVGDPALSRT